MPEAKDKLTFVLTVAPSGTGRDDLDLLRARLLLKSFNRYFDQSSLGRFLVVVPEQSRKEVEKALEPEIATSGFELIGENEICPEFADDPHTENPWPRPNKGWFRQQLIKLAIHEHVDTSFYVTLDSDVLFVRPFDHGTLVVDGRARLNVQNATDFARLYREPTAIKEAELRRARYRQAERVLRSKRPSRFQDQWYGETPVVMNADLARMLASRIEQTWQRPWRQALLANLPWTEYPLYFLFAEVQGVLEDHYKAGGPDTVLRLTQSLWQPADEYIRARSLSNWNPAEIFVSDRDGVAVVVQSYLGYNVVELAQKVEPYIG
jgi:hypothetical protein